MDAASIVDYARSLDCIHCGLCLRTCPTYQLTGSESSSPRGRIYLMRSVAEAELTPDRSFAEEMDFCLVCRHCESVCPAGVEFGAMMEFTRDRIKDSRQRGRLLRAFEALGLRVLADRRRLRRVMSFARLAQRFGLTRLLHIFGERGRALAGLARIPSRSERAPLQPRTAARGTTRARVALLEGCVMPELLGSTNRATVSVLSAIGIESNVPSGSSCCGALHAHNGDLSGARALARRTIEAFEGMCDEAGEPLPIVVNSAGCGAHLKEYGRILEEDVEWRERAASFAARVQDFTQLLCSEANLEALDERLAAAGTKPGELLGPCAFDDPCHLCHGQGIRAEPRKLLDRIPGLERVELFESESCCGSAGIYSLLRPADSRAVFEPRLEALRESGARTLVSANPGCQLQWSSGLRRAGESVEVLHLAEVLERALG